MAREKRNCQCPPASVIASPAGNFLRDVDDHAAVSGADFAIDLSLSSIEARRYVSKCARRRSPSFPAITGW
jgi:hypothetical protein